MTEAAWLIAIRVAITIAWNVITGTGTYWAWDNVRDAVRDKCNLLARVPAVNGVLLLEANGGVDDQRLILWAIALDFLSGLIALLSIVLLPPSPTPASVLSSLTGSAVGILLTVSAIVLTRLSFSKKRRRKLQMQKLLLSVNPGGG